MTLEQFVAKSGVVDVDEVEKALYFAFYHLKKNKVEEFSSPEAAVWINDARLGSPTSCAWAKNSGRAETQCKARRRTSNCTTTASRHSRTPSTKRKIAGDRG